MSGARDLDKMLADWPSATPTDVEREDFAARVVDSIVAESTGKLEESTEALLSAPLPARESEGNLAGRASIPSVSGVENKMSKDRGRDRASFQELAKLAGTPAPQPVTPSLTPPPSGVVRGEEASSDDSGIVDLKMVAESDPAASERSKSTPLAAQGLFDDEAPASAAAVSASLPPLSASAVAQSSPPPSASMPPASSSIAPASSASLAPAAPKKEEKKKGGGMIFLFGGLAIVAAAAGVFFVVKSGALSGANDTGTTAANTAAAKPAETGAPVATNTATPGATVAVADTSSAGVDMNLLPEDDQGSKRVMPKITANNGVTAKPTASVADTTPPPAGSVDPKLVANNIPNGGGAGGGDLTAAMKAAAGGGTAAATDTATGPQYAAGTVPQKPSQGQVQGAINAVLPEAKKCMAEGDPLSRANIVFQSDGTVKSVSVSGFAAGRPNEACVKAALSKAKISPFAEATYSFPVNVRSQ
ncbi:hypothetical protein BH09MYX1_BH09MYX1_65060 [soil metagenome]